VACGGCHAAQLLQRTLLASGGVLEQLSAAAGHLRFAGGLPVQHLLPPLLLLLLLQEAHVLLAVTAPRRHPPRPAGHLCCHFLCSSMQPRKTNIMLSQCCHSTGSGKLQGLGEEGYNIAPGLQASAYAFTCTVWFELLVVCWWVPLQSAECAVALKSTPSISTQTLNSKPLTPYLC
jgi:hypothetical protein